MNGNYLEGQVNYRSGPITAFRKYIFRDVLPAFDNLDQRADQVAEDYYNRIGAEPAFNNEYVDIGDIADAAQDHSLSWYEMMTSVRQTMRNLLAAGLFHLVEQQLAVLCRDAGFMVEPPQDTKLDKVAQWYKQHLRLDLKTLPTWRLMDELRLVANAVKHAEGSSTRKLEKLRPELFSNPDYDEIDKEFGGHGIRPRTGTISAPLAGEDLFVSENLLKTYAEAAECSS